MNLEKRQAKAEKEWAEKFISHGLDHKFEFLARDWHSDHGKKALVKCKTCGAVFLTWGLSEMFRGRQESLYCPECGIGSGEKTIKQRNPLVKDVLAFYAAGNGVKETAEQFGVSEYDVSNWAKFYKVSNGRIWHEVANKKRHENASGLRTRNHIQRAKLHNAPYESGITLKKLIQRDGLRCGICGEMCDPADHRWTKYTGPNSPSIDHIIPIAKGGGHTWDNVQVAHLYCNSLKKDSMEVTA